MQVSEAIWKNKTRNNAPCDRTVREITNSKDCRIIHKQNWNPSSKHSRRNPKLEARMNSKRVHSMSLNITKPKKRLFFTTNGTRHILHWYSSATKGTDSTLGIKMVASGLDDCRRWMKRRQNRRHNIWTRERKEERSNEEKKIADD